MLRRHRASLDRRSHIFYDNVMKIELSDFLSAGIQHADIKKILYYPLSTHKECTPRIYDASKHRKERGQI